MAGVYIANILAFNTQLTVSQVACNAQNSYKVTNL